jgi:uncharacterized membrane protein
MSPRTTRAVKRALAKTRLEAFSDGVFAIAATLLVLDVAAHPPGTPLQQVLQAWPSYVAYLVSFLAIGAAWIAHAALTDRLAKTDAALLRLNLFVLLPVVFLPFPTRLLSEGFGERDAERVAVTLFGLTLLAIRLAAVAMDGYARRNCLYAGPDEGADEEELFDFRRESWMVSVGYVAAIAVGLLAPGVAFAFYVVLILSLVVPFREIVALVRRQPDATDVPTTTGSPR